MANPNKPEYHGYKDALDSNNNKVNNYNELLRRAQLKKKDLMNTKAWVAEQGSIDDYVSVKPSAELALVDHYSAMPDVEMEPEIAEFWHSQQDALAEIDLNGPQNEYMSAYSEWQHLVERMDQKKRDELGVNGYDRMEENALKGIADAKKNLKDAKKRASNIETEVNPFKAALGLVTGTNQEAKKFIEAKQGVKKAKKGLKEANIRLSEVRERKAILQERKDELSVDEHMALEKMTDALEKMKKNQVLASQHDEKSKKMIATLHQQYETIDKFKALQDLKKKALNDPSTNLALNNQPENADLLNTLNRIPDQLPEKSFKITLNGPLQLPENMENIAEVERKIAEAKKHLPAGTDLNNLSIELDSYKIKEGETPETIQAEMDSMADKTTPEYKKLEMKKDHLVIQGKINDCNDRIAALKEQLINANTDDDRQEILKKLSNEQQIHKTLTEALHNDSYSKTVGTLTELQNLNQQKESYEQQSNLRDIDSISEQVHSSEFLTSITGKDGEKLTISKFYELLMKVSEKQKQQKLKELEGKHQKLPLEKANDEQEDHEEHQDGR